MKKKKKNRRRLAAISVVAAGRKIFRKISPQKLVAAVGNILRKIKGTAAPISEEGSRNRLEINMFRVTAENKDATASHAATAVA